MRRGFFAAVGLVGALVLTGCIDGGGFGNAVHETVDVTRSLSPTGAFQLENTNGSIHLATWDEPRVRIEAVKAAGTEEALRRIEVAVEGEGDRVEVRTRYPKGHWFGRGGKVDYTVTLPRQARVDVRTVNGRVEVQDVGGRLSAQTVNGTIDATGLGGEVEASTVNGTVEVALVRVEPSSRNRLSATNGTVRLTLPRDAAADVEATTVNGAVHCDFDVADGRVSRRRVEGRIGGGGARFELRTVNGTADIDRGLASVAAGRAASPAATPKPKPEAAPTPAR
jgi:hypothetical protein